MIPQTKQQKHYSSARHRFLRGALSDFFEREFAKIFGPILRTKIVDEVLKLLDSLVVPTSHLLPGECLWLAVDKATRADSPRRRFRAVKLTLIAPEDVKRLAEGVAMPKIASGAIARIMEQAYEQGGLLSMRDIELLTWHSSGALTGYRHQYEREHSCSLPHTGTLHDMGSCITHKKMIVEKAVIDKKNPRQIARETNHSLLAVERYINDYQRVRQCYAKDPSITHIAMVTGIAPHVVKQYVAMIEPKDEASK